MFQAEFFDIFGFLGFIYITGTSLWMLKNKKKLPKPATIILLILGILGLLIDGSIVINKYLI